MLGNIPGAGGHADLFAIRPDVKGFKTPEEAVRAELPGVEVRIVGVAVRGDEAVVAQIVNADGYPHAYETETATCYRGPDGWREAGSGNGNGAQIVTSDDLPEVREWLFAHDALA